MPILDAETKKKVVEATNPRQVAIFISRALFDALVSHADVDITIRNTQIVLSRSDEQVEIICDGSDNFRVRESLGFPKFVRVEPRRSADYVLSLEELDRRLSEWLNPHAFRGAQ